MTGRVILELYRAAQEMAVDEFQKFTIGLLNSQVPFDSARYVGGVLTPQGLKAQEFFLHNKSVEAVTDYADIASIDPVVRAMKARPGKMMSFHPPSMYAGRDKRPLMEYARRHEHMNGMSCLYVHQDAKQVQAVSIFRADTERHFQKQECWAMDQIAPHFLEAAKINHALALHRATRDADPSTVAIVCADGALHFCSSGFRSLANLEWPGWDNAILPRPLMAEILRIGSRGYCSENVRITAMPAGGLLLLRAIRASSITTNQIACPEMLQKSFGLTFAEARVAIALLEGRSAKEVAFCIKVSPHTVRTQIKSIYSKLGVNTRSGFVKTVLGVAHSQ